MQFHLLNVSVDFMDFRIYYLILLHSNKDYMQSKNPFIKGQIYILLHHFYIVFNLEQFSKKGRSLHEDMYHGK